MPFIQSASTMCFGKKTPQSPSKMSISGPISIPFDYDKNPLSPWQNAYSTHVPQPVPTPPPKDISTRYGYANTPKPVPTFDANWRQPEPQSQRKESYASSYYSRKESLASQYSRKESFGNWARFQRKGTAASVFTPPPRTKTGGSKLKSPLSPSKKWKLPTMGGKRLFRNAGLDEHGRLKLDYEDPSDQPDWGEPDEYRGPERRPIVWD